MGEVETTPSGLPREWQPKEVQRVPAFDPKASYRGDEVVYVEMLCTCGGILRIRGEANNTQRGVGPFIANFQAVHSGAGHAPTTDKVAVARAREALRYKGFLQARANPKVEDVPEDAEYVPTDWDSKNFGVSSEEVFADGFLATISGGDE